MVVVLVVVVAVYYDITVYRRICDGQAEMTQIRGRASVTEKLLNPPPGTSDAAQNSLRLRID